MAFSFYALLFGAFLLLLLILLYWQKKEPSSKTGSASEAEDRRNPSYEISSLYAAEKILDFLAYFESLPLKDTARRFLLTASTFEIMLYHETLGEVFQKYQYQIEENIISPLLLQETYLEKMKPYLGGDNGFVHFLAFSTEIRLSENDSATPSLCIPLTCGTEAQREKIIQETAKRYQKRYQKPFPYHILNAPDIPLPL